MPMDPLSLDFAAKCTCGFQPPLAMMQRSISTSCTCEECVRIRGGAYPPPSPHIGHRSIVGGGARSSARYPSNRRVAIG